MHKDPQLRMSAIDWMNHKWLKKSGIYFINLIDLETPFTRDVSSNELVKDKAFDISVDSSITGFKAIDKRKIIFKRGAINFICIW